MKEVKKKRFKLHRLNRLDMYVVGSICMIANYTIVSQLLAIFSGIELKTLTICIYVFFILEILFCATIKIFKIRKQSDKIITEAMTGNGEENDTEDSGSVVYYSQLTDEVVEAPRKVSGE